MTKEKLLRDRNVITISMSPYAAENYTREIAAICDMPVFTHDDVAIRISYDKRHPNATPEKFKVFESVALQDDVEILV
jgi:lantibiotic modifying enzyme